MYRELSKHCNYILLQSMRLNCTQIRALPLALGKTEENLYYMNKILKSEVYGSDLIILTQGLHVYRNCPIYLNSVIVYLDSLLLAFVW